MNKKAIIIAVIIFVLIVAGMFTFAYLKTMEMAVPDPGPIPEQHNDDDEFPVTRIDAKHYFRDGVHTLAGEIKMPTPCDLLTTNAAVFGENPEKAMVQFDVLNSAGDSCAQVVTTQRFKVSFEAGSDVEIEAMFKGEPVTLNLIEAGPGEDPADFEIFIKG